jgi:hypothetical protein
MCVMSTSSPAATRPRPQAEAKRLMPSVVPRVNTIWRGSVEPMYRLILCRALS